MEFLVMDGISSPVVERLSKSGRVVRRQNEQAAPAREAARVPHD